MSGIRWTQEQYEQAIKGVRAPDISEAKFQAEVMKVAAQLGWIFYHTHDSIGSAAGFPDLVLARKGRVIIFAELKTEKGVVTQEQRKWFEVLDGVRFCHAYVWRPSDMEEIVEILK
jgi:aldehyde:ferredoxin oxidoreductase